MLMAHRMGQPQEFETHGGEVIGTTLRLEIDIEPAFETRVLGRHPGRTPIGVTALRLDAADGEQASAMGRLM